MNTPTQSGSNPSSLPPSAGSNPMGSRGTAGDGAGQGASSFAGQGPAQDSASERHALQDKASALAREAKTQGQAELEHYRASALGRVETLAESARAAAHTLSSNDTLGLSQYVAELADNLSSFSAKLRGKSVDELIGTASDLARNNPALFIGGSIALGFGLSRFLKASNTSLAARGGDGHATAWHPSQGGASVAGPDELDPSRQGAETPLRNDL